MPINFSDYTRRTQSEPQQSHPVPPIGLLEGSPEQQAIWQYMLTGTTHAVVDAVAGSGKSTTLVQGVLRLRKSGLRIVVFAFNKHIADEMNTKFAAAGINYATACTYNSYGWRACKQAFPGCDLDAEKSGRIILDVVDSHVGIDNLSYSQKQEILSGLRKLTSLCKAYLLDGKDAAVLDTLCDKHNVTLNGSAKLVFEMVPLVLAACAKETSTMDFDDQVWQTVTKRLPVTKYDLVMTDESQDLNIAQQELTFQACDTNGRIIVVGDTHQAIYGFRGADAESMPKMQARLAATERGVSCFPLTVTRRCPKSHVALAQMIVPQIRAMDDAPEGEIDYISRNYCTRDMRPGDLVLCRTNAPLVGVCYELIRANVKAVIRGRDIGTGLLQLIDKLRAGNSVETLVEKAQAYRENELGKLKRLGDRGAGKRESLNDRVDCLIELVDGVNSVPALRQKIARIFSDFDDAGKPKDAVVLGSVHRTKGLEAVTVWVLCPELMPHPMAQQAWEQVQERNLAYVAVTRSKYTADGDDGRLVFVQGQQSNGLPPAFISTEQTAADEVPLQDGKE